MIDTVTKTNFIDWFRKSELRKDQFTYGALGSLFDHLEEYEEGTGEQIKFDPIAICCDYTEYKSIEEYNFEWSYNDDCKPVKSIDAIRELTTVIEIPNTKGFIIQQY